MQGPVSPEGNRLAAAPPEIVAHAFILAPPVRESIYAMGGRRKLPGFPFSRGSVRIVRTPSARSACCTPAHDGNSVNERTGLDQHVTDQHHMIW